MEFHCLNGRLQLSEWLGCHQDPAAGADEAGTGAAPKPGSEQARRIKAGGGGTPGAGTLCPTLLRALCFGTLSLQRAIRQRPAVGLPTHGQAGHSRGCECWPRGGRYNLGDPEAVAQASYSPGRAGCWVDSTLPDVRAWRGCLLLTRRPLNSLGGASERLGCPGAGHQEMHP